MAFDAVNAETDIVDFVITADGDDLGATSFVLDAGKNVTLTSSDGVFMIKVSAGRHGIVDGNLVLENITLDGNNTGGGIVVSAFASLTMNSGAAIRHCSADASGGAVYSQGLVTMNDGSAISDNVAKSPAGADVNRCGGGGVYNYNGTLEMKGGEISHNTASAPGGSNWYHYSGGGGVYNYNGTLEMKGGEISDNKLINPNNRGNYHGGGGVYNYNGTFLMEGGTLSYDEAIEGGAVYNFKQSVFTMSGGAVISGNKAIYGGAVYNSGTFSLETGAKIMNNSALYVDPPGGGYGGAVYNICSFLMQEGTEISGNTADAFGGAVYCHGSTYVDGAKRIAIFTMTGGKICNNESGASAGADGVALVSGSTFNMSGGEISENKGGFYGGGVYNYYSAFDMSGDAAICGNEAASSGGGVYNYYGTLDMSGDAAIYGNEAASSGGVYNYYSTFNMSGDAAIYGNEAASSGGGVYNYCSTLNMSGGKINGNKASAYGGGVLNYSNSIFNMTGGNVFSNTAGYGSGVANYNGTFTLTDGAISYNIEAIYGGGVYNHSSSAFNMAGGVISYNAAYCGGGIYGDGPLSITGGMITNNAAKSTSINGSGGGIYTTNFANLTVAGGVVFSGNVAPTLRTADIENDADIDGNGTYDLDDYAQIGAVVLDAIVDVGQNAPAYNNYDIGYFGGSYIVYVNIEADGTGTVTVADGSGGTVYGTLTSDGWVYVPITVGSITLSAAPESGYEFKQFIIDGGPGISGNPAAVPISGNTSVVAEFEPFSTSPGTNKYYNIKATADEGSTITPKGEVSILAGNNGTFAFFAKPEYRITAVHVDGVGISSEELASGKYTFFDVKKDHTIHVVSELADSPVDGGNSEKGDSSGDWAVLNLICAVLAVFTGVIALIAGRGRLRKDNGERRSKAALMFRVFALIIGLASAVIFFLTEDWHLPVEPTDEWTLLMFILFLAALIVTMVSFRYDEAPEDDAEEGLTEAGAFGKN